MVAGDSWGRGRGEGTGVVLGNEKYECGEVRPQKRQRKVQWPRMKSQELHLPAA